MPKDFVSLVMASRRNETKRPKRKGIGGVLTPKVIAVGFLIGAVTFPCTFLAKLIVERLPVHVHTVLLDAVVIVGGLVMIAGAFSA